jgi:hypothetical protein
LRNSRLVGRIAAAAASLAALAYVVGAGIKF